MAPSRKNEEFEFMSELAVLIQKRLREVSAEGSFKVEPTRITGGERVEMTGTASGIDTSFPSWLCQLVPPAYGVDVDFIPTNTARVVIHVPLAEATAQNEQRKQSAARNMGLLTAGTLGTVATVAAGLALRSMIGI